jgi:hypothetical protein
VSILRQVRPTAGVNAMPIDAYSEHSGFDPEATAAMGEAFDAACEELHCTTRSEVVRELIATLVIDAASRGELDPVRLRMVAVAGFATRGPRDPATLAADAMPRASVPVGARVMGWARGQGRK